MELRCGIEFDEGGESLTFVRRLALDNGWTDAFAARAVEEYRKFMFLAVTAGHPVTPSDQVDEVWHLHLAYTRSYWTRWCRDVLQTDMHHGPTKGGQAEHAKFVDWCARTKDSYARAFDAGPPADLWPSSQQRFDEDIHFQRVNTKRNWVAVYAGNGVGRGRDRGHRGDRGLREARREQRGA